MYLVLQKILEKYVEINTLSAKTGQTHSNDSSAFADEFFECVWLFCGVTAYRLSERTPEFLA